MKIKKQYTFKKSTQKKLHSPAPPLLLPHCDAAE